MLTYSQLSIGGCRCDVVFRYLGSIPILSLLLILLKFMMSQIFFQPLSERYCLPLHCQENRIYSLSCKESDNIAIAIQTKSTCCEKSVCIPSFCDPYFSTFGVNTETYGVSFHIQSECGKIRTRKTPNTGTSYAVSNAAYSQKYDQTCPSSTSYLHSHS